MTTEDNYIDTAILVTGTGGFFPDDMYMTKQKSLGITIGPLSFFDIITRDSFGDVNLQVYTALISLVILQLSEPWQIVYTCK